MDYPPLRLRLHPSHPAIGAGYRLLKGDERIAPGDETARVSLLLSVEHPEGWVSVEEHTVGMTVTESLIGDMDANERVYRRQTVKSKGTAVTWVLEAEVFPESHVAMQDAVLAAGGNVVLWRDAWTRDGKFPPLTDRAVVFHGSLGNADLITRRKFWQPGAFCNTEAFRCSSWYPLAARWLLHRAWEIIPANELTSNPDRVLDLLGSPESVFVRPDSPLKPFSGRVLHRNAISLRALDHGFYYDDETLPVVTAPVRRINREWRYVVVDREIITGSAYTAERRTPSSAASDGEPWHFAAEVARELTSPEAVYVLDVCEADGELHLLEVNPFSGADLYACDRRKIVEAVSQLVSRG